MSNGRLGEGEVKAVALDTPILSQPHLITLFGYLGLGKPNSTEGQGGVNINEIYGALVEQHTVLRQLLQHTAKGEEKEAIAIIIKNPGLAVSKSSFTEEWCGQREWTMGTSPLIYAAWAGDTAMVDLFLEKIPDELKPDALVQLKDLQKNGTEQGAHLAAVKQLEEAYEEYTYKLHKSGTRYVNGVPSFAPAHDALSHLILSIAKSQAHSVVNLLQWFCASIPFNPVPSFETLKEARSLFLHAPEDSDDIFSLNLAQDTILGVSTILVRLDRELEQPCLEVLYANTNQHIASLYNSHRAVSQFYQVRKDDLNRQISQLEQKILADQNNQQQSVSFRRM